MLVCGYRRSNLILKSSDGDFSSIGFCEHIIREIYIGAI